MPSFVVTTARPSYPAVVERGVLAGDIGIPEGCSECKEDLAAMLGRALWKDSRCKGVPIT